MLLQESIRISPNQPFQIFHIEDKKYWSIIIEDICTESRIKATYLNLNTDINDAKEFFSDKKGPGIIICDLDLNDSPSYISTLELSKSIQYFRERQFELIIVSGFLDKIYIRSLNRIGIPKNRIINKSTFNKNSFIREIELIQDTFKNQKVSSSIEDLDNPILIKPYTLEIGTGISDCDFQKEPFNINISEKRELYIHFNLHVDYGLVPVNMKQEVFIVINSYKAKFSEEKFKVTLSKMNSMVEKTIRFSFEYDEFQQDRNLYVTAFHNGDIIGSTKYEFNVTTSYQN